MLTKFRIVPVCVVALGSAVAAVGLASTSSAQPAEAQTAGVYSAIPMSTSSLSIADRTAVLASSIGVSHGVDPGLGRVIFRDSTESVYALAAKEGERCLWTTGSDGWAMTCPTTPGEATVMLGFGHGVGIVPDSVKEVTFKMTDGSTQTEAVTGNVWHAPAEGSVASYVQDGRTLSVELLPLSSRPPGISTSLPK